MSVAAQKHGVLPDNILKRAYYTITGVQKSKVSGKVSFTASVGDNDDNGDDNDDDGDLF